MGAAGRAAGNISICEAYGHRLTGLELSRPAIVRIGDTTRHNHCTEYTCRSARRCHSVGDTKMAAGIVVELAGLLFGQLGLDVDVDSRCGKGVREAVFVGLSGGDSLTGLSRSRAGTDKGDDE